MSRWIRVSTSIFEHELFTQEPLTEREAWLWLIAKAAWKDTHHRIGSAILDVPAGSMFTTLRELQRAWKWKSDTRVRNFLSMLSKQGMISLNSDAGKTQISICNYSRYQNSERTENAEKTQPERTENALKTPVIPVTPKISSLRSDTAQAPENPTPRRELLSVLDEKRADAVIQHRQRIRKPLTAHAAKLLAGKFSQWPDPNAAADAMVANGWQGFEVVWMENRNGSRATGPPARERTIFDAIDDFTGRHSHEPAPGPTIDHDGGNHPPNVHLLASSPRRGR